MAMLNVTIGNNINRKNVIIDSATTLRQAFELNGVDYSMGMASLDGATLAPGSLDKTFDEMGVTGERCFLLVSVKADNAAVSAKIMGAACVITSDHKLSDLELVAKYRPDSLALTEGSGSEKHEVFRVGVGKGVGSIGAYGAVWGEPTTTDGKATITMQIPADVANAKEWAEEKIGASILKLIKVEEALPAALEEVRKEKTAVAAAITTA